MKFKIVVVFLTLLMIGLFALSMFLALEVKKQKAEVERKNDELNISNIQLQEKNQELDSLNGQLDSTKSNLQQIIAELIKEKETNKETHYLRKMRALNSKYVVGVNAQAKNADFDKLVAFVIGQGYKIAWSKQDRDGFADNPRIYYYSDNPEIMQRASDLKNELEKKFINLYDIEEPSKGSSTRKYPPNQLIVNLKFKY